MILLFLLLLLAGSCGLACETLWMKMLTLVIGNTMFSIITGQTVFMGGLVLGSFLVGRFIDKIFAMAAELLIVPEAQQDSG